MRLFLAVVAILACGVALRALLLSVGVPSWIALMLSAALVLMVLGIFATSLIQALSRP